METIAILGGGNGGFAAAAHLQTNGFETQLYNRSEDTIAAIRDAGGIEYSGTFGEGFAPIPVITTDLNTALDGADAIMACLPAVAFEDLATQLAPHLDGTRPLLLNPGSTGGAFAVKQTLQETGCESIPPIAQTNTLTYICRKQSEAHVHVSSAVENVRFGTLPKTDQDWVLEAFQTCYPNLRPVENVVHASLSNVNAVLHPPGIVLSAAWIEHTDGDFRFYYDGATPAVASLMADLDEERLAVADAWGLNLDPFPELFFDIGSTTREAGESGSFLRAMRESEPNKSIKAPSSTDHRYFHEDIPYGLLPMCEFGRVANVETSVMSSLVTIASSITGVAYRDQGWTAERLGLPDTPDTASADL